MRWGADAPLSPLIGHWTSPISLPDAASRQNHPRAGCSPKRRLWATKSTVKAPTGRDSIAQGAAALGSGASKVRKPQRGEIPLSGHGIFTIGIAPLQGSGGNSCHYPGLRFAAPWAIESRPIRGCRGECQNKFGSRFEGPDVEVLSTPQTG